MEDRQEDRADRIQKNIRSIEDKLKRPRITQATKESLEAQLQVQLVAFARAAKEVQDLGGLEVREQRVDNSYFAR